MFLLFFAQHTICCRQLKAPQGLLGGIGRRVSSLLWGGMTTPTSSEAVSSLVMLKLNCYLHYWQPINWCKFVKVPLLEIQVVPGLIHTYCTLRHNK